MKKIVSMLLISLMLSLAMGCGSTNSEKIQGDSQSATNHADEEDVNNDTNQKVEVDEGLLEVEVTLPASFFSDSEEEVTQESLEEKIKDEDGIKSVKLNEDGSVTYEMTKKKQKEMLDEIKASIDESCQSLVDSEDTSFVSIDYNDDVTEFTCVMTNTEPNLSESFSVISIYLLGAYYNTFAGESDFDVKVQYVNEESGETVYEGSYQEWLKKTESSDN